MSEIQASLLPQQRLVATVIALLLASSVHSQSVTTFLDAAIGKRVMGGETVKRAGVSSTLELTPLHPAFTPLHNQRAEEKPTVIAEGLFLCRLQPATQRGAALLTAYNIMRSPGSLQGIEYWSASRKKQTVLFLESWTCEGPDSLKKIPDRTVSSLPERERLWIWQKDASLGGALYSLDLGSTKDLVTAAFVNQSAIKASLLTLVQPGDMTVRAYILACDEGLLVYLSGYATPALLPGLAGKFVASMENRLDALRNWFLAEIGARQGR